MIHIGSIQGNVTVNDIHHNQVVYLNGKKAHGEHEVVEVVQEEAQDGAVVVLPVELSTPQAMHLWEQAVQAGWIDASHQPLISRTKAALLAYEMARRLGIENKWKMFEALWHRNNMRSDYNDAMEQRQSLDFRDKIKEQFD